MSPALLAETTAEDEYYLLQQISREAFLQLCLAVESLNLCSHLNPSVEMA